MTVDENVVTSDKLAAHSIDFVEQFSDDVKTLLSAIGHVRMHPMASGTQTQTYKKETKEVTSRTIDEGEVIPLTQAKRTKDKAYTLNLTGKLRKVTTSEVIQQDGFDQAVTFTDQRLLSIAQKNAKKDLFSALTSKGTTATSGNALQGAISNGLGKLAGLFEDVDNVGTTVVYANPSDVYGYLDKAQITTQTTFSSKYLQNFLNADVVFLSTSIPEDRVVLTIDNNINFYYVDMHGQAGNAFNMTVDETGLIGVTHSRLDNSLGYQTVTAGGWLILPERTDGTVISSITIPRPSQAGGAGVGH